MSMLSLLRPYQDRASDALATAVVERGFGLDASATGIGKTFHALAVVEKVDAPRFVVVCRAVARPKWRATIEDLGMGDRCLGVDSWDRFRAGALPGLCIRQSAGRRTKPAFSWQPLREPTLVIFDEAQDAGGFRTANAEMLVAASRAPQAYPLCLSASVADSPLRMYALGFATGMHRGVDEFFWWCRRNGCVKSPFGGLYFKKCGQSKKSTPRHPRGCCCGEREVLRRLHEHLFPAYGVMVTYEEAKVDLPPETVAVELWDLPKSLPRCLRVFEEAIDLKEEEDLRRLDEGGALGAVGYIRERQRAELYKVPALAEEVEASVAAGRCCPVFLSHSASIDALSVMLGDLGVSHGILDGRDHKRARESHTRFQGGRLDVLITQYQAGSASIDMHDERGDRPRETYLSPFPSAEKMIQALGRAYRVNLKSPVTQRIFFASKTVEESVYQVAHRRARNIRAMSTGEWDDSWN